MTIIHDIALALILATAAAAGSPDIVGQMRALEDLRGYDDL